MVRATQHEEPMIDAPKRIRTEVSNSDQPLQPDYKANGSADRRAMRTATTIATRVTVDNFCRAETDRYFAGIVKEGGFGILQHNREPVSTENQMVIRPNRDTLYSSAVFDLDAGPVTIWLPDSRGRFMSLMALDEDAYVSCVAYARG